jgi:phosphatidylinositol kinase/protein kinase (PI-3  family)
MPVVPSIIDSLPLSNVAPRLVSISLEALGELAAVAHSSLNPWLQQLIPHILENMLDQNSSKQCISLATMGKISFGTGYVILPYLDYPHLLPQASDILPTTKRAPWELRREVFRLFGTLGAIDPDRLGSSSHRTGGRVGGGYFVDFEDDQYLLAKQYTPAVSSSPKRGANLQSFSPGMLVSRNVSSPMPDFRASVGQSNKVPPDGGSHKNTDNDEPAHLFMYEQYTMASQPLTVISSRRRLVPSDSDFYPTVAISALVSILRNQALSTLHTMVMKAVMFIFNALGIQSVPFLKQIVPHILATIKHSDQPGIREALLQQLTSLSTIVREHLRPYLASIFNVVEEFWFTKHLSSLCNLVERIATAVPDDVREFVPLLVRLILSSIEDIDTTEWSSTTDSERLMILCELY